MKVTQYSPTFVVIHERVGPPWRRRSQYTNIHVSGMLYFQDYNFRRPLMGRRAERIAQAIRAWRKTHEI